jgi:hypothetical protein
MNTAKKSQGSQLLDMAETREQWVARRLGETTRQLEASARGLEGFKGLLDGYTMGLSVKQDRFSTRA